MSLAIPGSKGCFSFLQEVLTPTSSSVNITSVVRDQLKDFLWLAKDIINRSTHLAKVVPSPPSYLGSMDAAKEGMGGVWFPPDLKLPGAIQPCSSDCLTSPILWRCQLPTQVQNNLVSTTKSGGAITNSDLELAGSIAHDDILASAVPISRLTLSSFSDNTPTVVWRNKGSTTTSVPAAYLLQLASLHQRHHRYRSELNYIPGPRNTMADDCSRLWKLTDFDFISYSNITYPQKKSWKLLHLRPAMASALISSLLKKRAESASYLQGIKKHNELGQSGVRFAPQLIPTPTSRTWPIPSRCYKPLASDGVIVDSPPVVTLIEVAQWRTPYGLSARRVFLIGDQGPTDRRWFF